MMERFFRLTALALIITLLSISPVRAIALEGSMIPQDYTAVYRVLRNGQDVAEVTISLSHQDDVWTLHGFTHDMQGLADLLNVRGVQTATGRWQDGRFVPENYQYSFSVVGYKTTWQADFDWPSGVVTSSGKKGDVQLPLTSGAIDPFSLSLNIGSFLAASESQMNVNVVDENKIRNHLYQVDIKEPVDTALGCLETTRVKRMRKKLRRNSLVWYANEHNYVPVLIHHSKKKGNSFRLQIISLDIDGQPILPAASCEKNAPEFRQVGLGNL
jgi:hypothetical protein